MKQVIVVNHGLKMPKGKLAAQVAHAAVAAFLTAKPDKRKAWLSEGMPKVVLKASDEAELQTLQREARIVGVANCLIQDAGRTVLPAGTITCLGLGPADDEELHGLTGELKLL